MQIIQDIEKSFSDERIRSFQSTSEKETTLITSPQGVAVARTFSLMDEELATPIYTNAERRRMVEQIRFVISEVYVHQTMKEAQFGYDAIRSLDRLEPYLTELTDEEFHQSIVQLITRTKDRHLAFQGRNPNGISAVLPFQIERCWIEGNESYVVTKIRPGQVTQNLEAGAIVTHWNGTPIARHIRLTANLFDGGNEPASIARSLEFLTQRSLSRFTWPIESWVNLRFLIEDQPFEERFDWEGFDLGLVPDAPAIGRNAIGFGGDLELFQSQLVKRAEFTPESFDEPGAEVDQSGDGTPVIVGHKNNFAFGSVTTAEGTFAYIRLYNFGANNVDDIANDMIDAFGQIPRNGLIIDMRGNSGGYIAAGERLLQLLTPRTITPTRFQFRATQTIRRMMMASSYFDRWKQSIDEALRTGEAFSQGYPIEGTDADANQLGQYYFGPVVLMTDALAFSTADMFAAGFIDHSIGRVLCIDKNMAAAGGNNWRFDVLRLFIPEFQMDSALKADLDNGIVSDELRSAFNANGVSVTSNATNSGPNSEFGGTVWQITDGELRHEIRHVPWMNDTLNVYPANGSNGLKALPSNLRFEFTVRRCIRTGPNEGRLLEDLGIRPDLEYQPTFRDVMENNQDMLIRATEELSTMEQHDLRVETSVTGEGTNVACHTLGVSDLEVYLDGKHFQSIAVSSTPVELIVPAAIGETTMVIKGYDQQQLVANRLIRLGS